MWPPAFSSSTPGTSSWSPSTKVTRSSSTSRCKARTHLGADQLVQVVETHHRAGPELVLVLLDDELGLGKEVEAGEVIHVEVGHDDGGHVFRADAQLAQQLGRLPELIPLSPFRGDVVRMVGGIHHHRAVGSLDAPDDIGYRLVPLRVAADARHDARVAPVLRDADGHGENGVVHEGLPSRPFGDCCRVA